MTQIIADQKFLSVKIREIRVIRVLLLISYVNSTGTAVR